MSFYNTIALKEPELKKARVKAKSQEDLIYELIIGGGEWTATRINEIFPKWLKTSIRRSLTDLAKDDKIERVGDPVPSPHGSKEGKYKAVKQTKLF